MWSPKQYSSVIGWVEMSMPTQLGPTRVDVRTKNVTLVMPVVTVEKVVPLYCLGGQWLQRNGQPMPQCVSPKTTGKNDFVWCSFTASKNRRVLNEVTQRKTNLT